MIIDLLEKTGALQKGHFLLSSGKHSNRYVQCAKLLQYPDKAEKAIRVIVNKIQNLDFDIIVGPAMGGVIVSYELGRQTGKPSIFVERQNGIFCLRRGFTIKEGQKVLIAEDVVTTGKSSYEAIKVVEKYGAEVVGIACIVDRTNKKLDYPIYGAEKLQIDVFDRETCPLCQKGIPYEKPGSRNIEK